MIKSVEKYKGTRYERVASGNCRSHQGLGERGGETRLAVTTKKRALLRQKEALLQLIEAERGGKGPELDNLDDRLEEISASKKFVY